MCRQVSGPDDDVVSNEVQDLGGGKYAVAFEPKLPGIHTISIQHQGEEIKDGPFRINVGGTANLPRTPRVCCVRSCAVLCAVC